MAIEADDLLSRVVAHIATLPERYELLDVQMPALVEIGKYVKRHPRLRSAALSRWMEVCQRELESLTAAAPQPPTDFRREATVRCKCADCTELNRFLSDPATHEHRFQMAQDRRSHLQSQIGAQHCDLDCETDRRPRPQVLVCTKNTATHRRLLKEYHQNVKHLDTVRSLQQNGG